MNTQSYLIFNSCGIKYGISTSLVKEIFLLPELVPIADAPVDIVGILNLRGKILPIMHLSLRLGNLMQECKISDSAIILQWKDLQIGIIVNDVYEVRDFDSNDVEKNLDYGRIVNIHSAFVEGVAKNDLEEIILLNGEALIREPDAVKHLMEESSEMEAEAEDSQGLMTGSFYDLCCPHATPLEKGIFRQRAHNLRASVIDEILGNDSQDSLAIMRLGGEYFGIDLDVIQEFIKIQNFTPIPCSPQHIIGNVNLRGEVLTLVDIRGILNLPLKNIDTGTQAIVINVDNIIAGLPVDEVLDVMSLPPESVNSMPIAVHSGSKEYLRGMVDLGKEQVLSIIDLPKLIAKGGLDVNETV
jgi:purine-binding chemotaxis protein CheW